LFVAFSDGNFFFLTQRFSLAYIVGRLQRRVIVPPFIGSGISTQIFTQFASD
jgi:hypothetical protein